MKRSELQRTVGLARGAVQLSRRTPLARTAMKTARQPAVRAQKPRKAAGWGEDTRETVQRRCKGRCELGSCGERATDLHHRQRRREGNHTAANALALCRAHHQHVHANPAESRRNGWIVSFSADPTCEPVVRCGELVWLTETGNYVSAGRAA